MGAFIEAYSKMFSFINFFLWFLTQDINYFQLFEIILKYIMLGSS